MTFFRPQNQPTLRLLTLKAFFLVMLATAYRACEVPALSGLPADISSEVDGSMSVRYLPEFRAKTHVSRNSPITIIQPLATRLAPDDDDRFSVPCSLSPSLNPRAHEIRALSASLALE